MAKAWTDFTEEEWAGFTEDEWSEFLVEKQKVVSVEVLQSTHLDFVETIRGTTVKDS